MRAALLGGNGFIGSHLVDELIKNRWSVKVFDNAMERFRSPIAGVEYHLCGLEDTDRIVKSLDNIDILFHLISTTVPGTSNTDPALDIQSNVLPTIKLLEACLKKRISKVVFLSSGGAIYGVPLLIPISEDHMTNPESSYGIMKLTIEKYLDLFYRLYGLDYTIIRPANPFGARQNPFGIQGAIPVFLERLKTNKPVEIWGDGTVVRDYLPVEDLVHGIYLAASIQTEKRIFNFGSGIGYSLNELLELLKKVTGRTACVINKDARPFDPPSVVLDISRAKEILGWTPQIPMEDGIRRTWEFVRSIE